MILGATNPGIVGQLVIIPLRDHRIALVQLLQIRIEAIRRVAQPIVSKRNHLVRRFDHATCEGLANRGVSADRIFVKIIADVHDEIEIVALAGMRICVEPTERQIGAGKQANAEFVDRSCRQGARTTDDTTSAIRRDEAIVVPTSRCETFDYDLGGVIAIRSGDDFSAGDEFLEHRVARDFRTQLDIGIAHEARPQQHGVCRRLTTGDTMREATTQEHTGDTR